MYFCNYLQKKKKKKKKKSNYLQNSSQAKIVNIYFFLPEISTFWAKILLNIVVG